MGYFPVRYDSRVENYDRKMFIRLATVLLQDVRIHFWLYSLYVLYNTFFNELGKPKNEVFGSSSC